MMQSQFKLLRGLSATSQRNVPVCAAAKHSGVKGSENGFAPAARQRKHGEIPLQTALGKAAGDPRAGRPEYSMQPNELPTLQ